MIRNRKNWSLRRELTLLAVGAVAAIGVGATVITQRLAHREADRLFDAQLRQAAEMMFALAAGSDIGHFAREISEHRLGRSLPFEFEIRLKQGDGLRLIGASEGVPRFPGLPAGFSNHAYLGGEWRFYNTWEPQGQHNIRVALPEDLHQQLEERLSVQLLLPLVVALPLMALGVGLAVRRALRPVEKLTGEVAGIDPSHLDPLPATPLPVEIGPLRDALNGMIARLAAAFENERRFTADAAHELRTPLAALKVQAQVAARATEDEGRRHALCQVAAGVDRMTHLVEQLLTLARVRPEALAEASADAADIAAQVCAERMAAADRQGQTLEVDATPACAMRLPPVWLASLVGNLVDNAIRYAGHGATIRVRVRSDAAGDALRVEDDGHGVAPADRERLVARFARGDEAHEVQGCGLGLSIVARIAEASGGEFRLTDGLPRADGGHGLAAEVRWPRS